MELSAPATRPVVAVVGRPNVGKSTLVNRIVGRREAIVEEHPGVTRDRKELVGDWAGREFLLVDTGGWMPTGSGDALDDQVSAQARRAMATADAVVLVVDGTVGVTEADAQVATVLRRGGPPVLVAVNKADNDARDHEAWAFVGLGLGEPVPVSALHGRGSGDLLDRLVALLADPVPAHPPGAPTPPAGPAGSADPSAAEVPSVAIVGRPNVGKSTLFNRMVGDERAIVHDRPGTTRDTVDTVVDAPQGRLRFVDTAGMRRKSRIDDGPEYYALVRALAALDRSDAALLVLDAVAGVTHQDQRLAERADAAGCAVVVLLNRWDLLDAEARAAATRAVGERLGFLAYAPVLKVSALTGKGVHRILPALDAALGAYRRRVPTAQLNEVLRRAQAAHPTPTGRVLYATQGATDPPTFTLFVSRPLPPTYLRYLERSIREAFAFGPTPLKLRVRRRSG